jgi:hypothetical protein
LLAQKPHAGIEKNKAAARKIDNLISIPESHRTYRAGLADWQEDVFIRANAAATGL